MARSMRSASDQRTSFDSQMAQSARYALDQQTHFESHMAKAELDASDMKEAYEQMTCNFEDQKKAIVKAAQLIIKLTHDGHN